MTVTEATKEESTTTAPDTVAESKVEVDETVDPKKEEEKDSSSKDKEDKPAVSGPETIEAVAERLKFFFSNANVRKDNFLRKILMEKNAVPVETLLKFNSIKALTADESVVVQAAKSKTLDGFLTVSQDEKEIGRVKAFDESQMEGHIPVSLFLTHIPHEDGKYLVSVQEIRDFFEPHYGSVAIIKLGFHTSRNRGRKPKGSCMVEFEEAASLEKAAADVLTCKGGEAIPEPKRKFMVGEQQIQISTLQDHIEQSKKKADEKEDEDEPVDEDVAIDWKKGCVIRLKGLSKDCDREAILDALAKSLDTTAKELKGKIYVDFSRGQTDGAIRFEEPSDKVTELSQKLAGGEIQIAGAKVESAKVLEGEEEENYRQSFIEFKRKKLRHRADEQSNRKKKRHRRD